MRQLLSSMLAVAALSFSACDAPFSDGPTDYSSDDMVVLDTTLTSNGFVIAEGEADRLVFSLDNGNAYATYSILDNMTEVAVTGSVRQANNRIYSIVMQICFPGTKRGVFPWENPLAEDAPQSIVAIGIDGTKYYSDSGATHVRLYRDLNGNVVGTFSGTLRTPFGDSIVVTDGRFDAQFIR